MKRTSLVVATLCTIAVCFSACKEKKFKDYEKTETGLYYKFNVKNSEGRQPQMGDFLFMTVSWYSDNDSINAIFPKLENHEIMDVLIESKYGGDIYEAYAMLREGEEADFVLKADSFFNFMSGQIPPVVGSEDVLFFTIRMDRIKTMDDFEQEEEEAIKGYFSDKTVMVEPRESGLYYIETLHGKGAKVEEGKSVSVHYTGMFLDGTVFDSSVERGTPLTFTVGVDRMIEGFVEGVLLMNQGGKATFLLPSNIAYGMSHPSAPIPPFTPLLFEVEIVEVK